MYPDCCKKALKSIIVNGLKSELDSGNQNDYAIALEFKSYEHY